MFLSNHLVRDESYKEIKKTVEELSDVQSSFATKIGDLSLISPFYVLFSA